MRDLFPSEEETRVRTRYGSVTLYRCAAGGNEFLFIPRHGADASIPPHRINFKATLQALKTAGVGRVIAASAVGSISGRLRVGEMGLLDQFIDLSKRHVTYFDERPVHVDMTRPYDPGLQKLILDAAVGLRVKLNVGLVYVSVDGPRYETAAEIRMFGLLGGDVVGMTGAPEAILANELGMRYASIVVATNWAAGMQEKVSHGEVEAMMGQFSPRIKKLIERAIGSS
jgi:5'-methylthioadenosine phosphorylase